MSVDPQGSLFGDGRMAPAARRSTPDPQAIRGRLGRLLETLRSSQTMPLSDRDVRMWQTVVPNMTRWLPMTRRVRSAPSSPTKWSDSAPAADKLQFGALTSTLRSTPDGSVS